MRKLALLAVFFFSFSIAEGQNSGWVMDLGDGVYYWNSWNNSSGRSNSTDQEYSEALYDKYMAEGKLEFERMVADAEGLEKLIRNIAFKKKVLGDEFVYKALTEIDFKFIGSNDSIMKFTLQEDGFRHVINILETYYAGEQLLFVTITTSNFDVFHGNFERMIRQSSSKYNPTEYDLDPIYVYYSNESASKISVIKFSYKSDSFAFINNEDYSTLGVIYKY
ncbi:MAG: hypothetical protein ACQETL_18440 [Bacteroidota bacterium]